MLSTYNFLRCLRWENASGRMLWLKNIVDYNKSNISNVYKLTVDFHALAET